PGPRTDFERREADWLDVATAQARILADVRVLPLEAVPLLDALGRVLGEDLTATATLPPWDNSAMDGYAVRGEDIADASGAHPVQLRVVGRVHAGETASPTVGPGEAVRIMTGAPIPPGADSVVRVEDTDAEVVEGTVQVVDGRDAGRNVRPGGEDVRSGERVLRAGDVVGPGAVGVAAAIGRDRVRVPRRPSVALLPTGDELRRVDRYEDVRSGLGVPESNTPMLAAAVVAAGGVPHDLGVTPDDPAALRSAVERSAQADVLVTMGGASMGEADLVKRVLDDAGYRQAFWRVTMRPGSPFSFGFLTRPDRLQPVFGLPGNPASAFVTFELFVRPFLLRLGGHRAVHRRRVRGRAGERLPGAGDRTMFLRVTLDDRASPPVVRSTGPHGSGLVRGLARVAGLAIVPAGRGAVEEGEAVDVLLLDRGCVEDVPWKPEDAGA
ncbi:MAG: molybdopterin molybdotransferase MoeA, partial [Gemmatimonadota bacterium]